MKLSMSIHRFSHPYADKQFNPLEAVIVVSDGNFGRTVSIVSDSKDQFKPEALYVAFRELARSLETMPA
jgi:hypothetical protein